MGKNISIDNNTILGYNGDCEDITQYTWCIDIGSNNICEYTSPPSLNNVPFTLAGTPFPDGLPPGNHIVTLIADNEIICGSTEASITLNVYDFDASNVAMEVDDTLLCQGDALMPSITMPNPIPSHWITEWELTDNVGNVDTSTAHSPTFNPSGNGEYTLSLTIGINPDCSAVMEQDIIVLSTPSIQLDPIDDTTGCDSVTVTPTLNILNATAQTDVEVLVDGILISYTLNEPLEPLTFHTSGTHQINVSASNPDCVGSSANASITFNVDVLPSPTVNASALYGSVFTGGSDTLLLSGADEYAIFANGGSIGTTTENTFGVTPSQTTTYTVVGETDGCEAEATVTITASDEPSINIILTNEALCDAPATASASATVTNASPVPVITWTSTSGNINGINNTQVEAAYLSTGLDTLTATFTFDGITYSDTAYVEVCNTPNLSTVSPIAICMGDQVQLNASGTADEYEWFDENGVSLGNAASITVTPPTNTVYTIEGTNCDICEAMDSVEVIVELPAVSITFPDVLEYYTCPQASPITLMAEPPGGTWTVDGLALPTNVFDPALAEDTYETCYEYTNPATACSNMVCMDIIVVTTPDAAIDGPALLCTGEAVTFNGVEDINNTWTINGDTISTAQNLDFTPTAAGSVNIGLTVGSDDCINYTEVTLPVIEPPTAGFTLSSLEVCSGDTINVQDTSIGQIDTAWWIVNGQVMATLSQLESPTQNTDTVFINITRMVGNECGMASLNQTILVNPVPSVAIGLDDLNMICSTESRIVYLNSLGNPTQFELDCNYCEFENADNINFALSDTAWVVFNIGVSDVAMVDTLIVGAFNGCGMTYDTLLVEIQPQETIAGINVEGTDLNYEACIGDIITFTNISVASESVLWDLGDGTLVSLDEFEYEYQTPGEYWVYLTAEGCGIDTDSVLIKVLNMPSISVLEAPPTLLCEGDTIWLSTESEDNVLLTWLVNNQVLSNSPDVEITFEAEGEYNIELIADVGNEQCNQILDVMVAVQPNYQIEMEDTLVIKFGEAVFLDPIVFPTPDDATQFFWENDNFVEEVPTTFSPMVTPTSTTTYTLTIDNEANCMTSASTTVVVEIDSVRVSVPTAFSPNGDGLNDFMRPIIEGTHNIDYYEFAIYHRWGEDVYKTNNAHDKGWEGNFKDRKDDMRQGDIDVYAYYLIYTTHYDSQLIKLKGNITLVR